MKAIILASCLTAAGVPECPELVTNPTYSVTITDVTNEHFNAKRLPYAGHSPYAFEQPGAAEISPSTHSLDRCAKRYDAKRFASLPLFGKARLVRACALAEDKRQ